MNIDEKIVKQIVSFLKKKLDPVFIYLFGSAVEGYFLPDSDIDMGVFLQNEMGDYDLFMIREELADLLKREIDLINLEKTSSVFKAQIIGNGVVIYARDDYILSEFQIRTLKEYTLLNEERAIILDRIKEEGTIYE